jgi:hypothetical protein
MKAQCLRSILTTQPSKAVSLPPCLSQGGEENSSYSFLATALDGVSGQRDSLAAHYHREWTVDTLWIGSWVGLRAGLDTD